MGRISPGTGLIRRAVGLAAIEGMQTLAGDLNNAGAHISSNVTWPVRKGDNRVINSIAWWPTVLVLGIACFTDIRSRRIPNWLVVPFALAGLIANCVSKGWAGLITSLLGVGLAVLVCGVFCYLRGMGMGDFELYAAIGAWIGPRQLQVALVVTFVAGAVIGILWALCTRSLARSLASTGDLLAGFRRRGIRPHDTIVLENAAMLKIPYAPAIAIGTLFSFFAV